MAVMFNMAATVYLMRVFVLFEFYWCNIMTGAISVVLYAATVLHIKKLKHTNCFYATVYLYYEKRRAHTQLDFTHSHAISVYDEQLYC